MNRPRTSVLLGALGLALASCSAFEVADEHADHTGVDTEGMEMEVTVDG